ncbi:Histone-lysine N-methyltransferase, H3 lysine-79 specific [Leucoagaricus sp. SymC.cos]|nr:Histone-lysine N-methyltransferase, H3 lysine-79 specific [Leucoagaricus sp. SymC.cos]
MISSTDFGFFSDPSPLSSPSSLPRVIVHSRHISSPRGSSTTATPVNSSPLARSVSSPSFSSPVSAPVAPVSKKRKLVDDDEPTSAPEPKEPKRQRAVPKKKTRKRKSYSSAPTRAPSRASSHLNGLASSPEPIYRSDRSRSTSLFPGLDPDVQPSCRRRWRTDEDGVPGDDFLSSELIVRRLIKSYKACMSCSSLAAVPLTCFLDFRNPNNNMDMSFEPENFPVAELEYPNTGAKERFLLLAPKDKDHYNPIMDLEKTLLTIVNRQSF